MNTITTAEKTNKDHFEEVFEVEDPWDYSTSEYEQNKYKETISMLPKQRFRRVLEFGAAEGVFTEMLAPYASQLIAADISSTALDRAKKRLRKHSHIKYANFDMTKMPPLTGSFDLIVLGEILYYANSDELLYEMLIWISNMLASNGHIISVHANSGADPDCTHNDIAFNWGMQLGAHGISRVFSEISTLGLTDEYRTPLYRIQVYEKKNKMLLDDVLPNKIKAYPKLPLHSGLIEQLEWGSGITECPILMYHRVTPKALEKNRRYWVTPEEFEAQLKWLKLAGYKNIALQEWANAIAQRRKPEHKCVCFTFDDGYRDFKDYAYTLLSRYGYTATVFLVTSEVGGVNKWDRYDCQEEIALLSWDEISDLASKGIEFGSHTATHVDLGTELTPTEKNSELRNSRRIIELKLHTPISSFSYPYGAGYYNIDEDAFKEYGYNVAVTATTGISSFSDSLLALPRLEIEGCQNHSGYHYMDDFKQVVEKGYFEDENSIYYAFGRKKEGFS